MTTPSLTVSAPAAGTVGTAFAVSGTVAPVGDVVSLQLSQQATTLPSTGAWQSATTVNGGFAGALVPPSPGTWYAWAYDQITGASSVSGAIKVPNPDLALVPAVPLTVEQAQDLEETTSSGLTNDQLPAAAAASDTDTLLTGQGTKSLFAQPLAAIWTWLQGKLPGYLRPQVTITSTSVTQLQNSAHNGRILVVTAAGASFAPLLTSLGPGFTTRIINVSGATVGLSGMTTSTGATGIATGNQAEVSAFLAGSPATLQVFAKL